MLTLMNESSNNTDVLSRRGQVQGTLEHACKLYTDVRNETTTGVIS